LQNCNITLLVEKESWIIRFISLSLQPSVSGVGVSLHVKGFTLDMLSMFCDGFVVWYIHLMQSTFLHLSSTVYVLRQLNIIRKYLFDCFVNDKI